MTTWTDLLKKFFPHILFIALIISQILLWNGMQDAKKELAAFKESMKKEETVININKPTGVIEERETDVYPKIDKNIERLNNNIKNINVLILREEKNKPMKGKSYEKFKDQGFTEINKYFNDYFATPTDNNGSGK